MNKVASTYWGNSVSMPKLQKRQKTKVSMKSNRESTTPQWFFFAVVVFITFMLCLTVNFRAFSELSLEMGENQKLNSEIEQLKNRNQAIEQEIDKLKTDQKMIEREAHKLGMGRADEQIFVTQN